MNFPTIESCIGNTPLVRLQRMAEGSGSTVLVKLEGNNPAGSGKDRPALSMLAQAEKRGEVQPGDVLIEASSGNAGIALAMAAAVKGYRLILIMPEHMSTERKQAIAAYGAELVEVSREGGMEEARDLALEMQQAGRGRVLDQFTNADNPQAHYEGTGPEIWQQTEGRITHFVSAMGTTGTVMGVSRYLKEQNPEVSVVGLQPREGENIAGILRWPSQCLPKIFDRRQVDRILDISLEESKETARALSAKEGILAGMSSGSAVAGALQVAREERGRVVVTIACDRGDRYLSTGLFPLPAVNI